jgi:hypothetical protein
LSLHLDRMTTSRLRPPNRHQTRCTFILFAAGIY